MCSARSIGLHKVIAAHRDTRHDTREQQKGNTNVFNKNPESSGRFSQPHP